MDADCRRAEPALVDDVMVTFVAAESALPPPPQPPTTTDSHGAAAAPARHHPVLHAVQVAAARRLCALRPRPLSAPADAPQYAQELLSTFGAALGEVALQPAGGGAFVIVLETAGRAPLVLWDHARDNSFPETKVLKRRVRDVVDPARHFGHVDAHRGSSATAAYRAATDRDDGDDVAKPPTATGGPAPACDDCAS